MIDPSIKTKINTSTISLEPFIEKQIHTKKMESAWVIVMRNGRSRGRPRTKNAHKEIDDDITIEKPWSEKQRFVVNTSLVDNRKQYIAFEESGEILSCPIDPRKVYCNANSVGAIVLVSDRSKKYTAAMITKAIKSGEVVIERFVSDYEACEHRSETEIVEVDGVEYQRRYLRISANMAMGKNATHVAYRPLFLMRPEAESIRVFRVKEIFDMAKDDPELPVRLGYNDLQDLVTMLEFDYVKRKHRWMSAASCRALAYLVKLNIEHLEPKETK